MASGFEHGQSVVPIAHYCSRFVRVQTRELRQFQHPPSGLGSSGYVAVAGLGVAFFHVKVGKLQVLEPAEAGFLQACLDAVDGAAIDGKDTAGPVSGFHDTGDSAADTGETEHHAVSIVSQFPGGPIRNFADIGAA